MHFNKNGHAIKGASIAANISEAAQRKADRTTLLAMSSKLDGNMLTSPSQKKIFELLAEGSSLMGRQTDDWPKNPPETQKLFLTKARKILSLPAKTYTDEQALEALESMKPFWAYIEGTWSPTKDFKTNAQAMTMHINRLGGTSAGDDNALQELKEAMK